jgi:hypothetical protein
MSASDGKRLGSSGIIVRRSSQALFQQHPPAAGTCSLRNAFILHCWAVMEERQRSI